MTITPSSLAQGVGASVNNVVFRPGAVVIPRKILIIASYDPLKTAVVDEVPVQVTSADEVGSIFGFGFMAHRLAVQSFIGSQGVPTYIQPQSELGGAVVAAGDITITAVGAQAGTLNLYIAGIRVPVSVATGDTQDAINTAMIAAINANQDLPVTALVDGINSNEADITSKSKGTWGNDISITFNEQGESFPVGVSVVVTDMASGTTVPVIADALDALGTGDNANGDFYTDIIHGYGQDPTTLDSLSTYNGIGNTAIGLYSKLVGRPFRSLYGDVDPDTAALTALKAITDIRLEDRTNGFIAAPGSPNHPGELAAQAMGHMARINANLAEQNYKDVTLTGILPGVSSEWWTSDYTVRDDAVKSGISPTLVDAGSVKMQNVVTFYRPANVPVGSNGYRSMRNISILQNLINSVRVLFKGSKYQGVTIVDDVQNVGSVGSKQKVLDIDAVKGDLISLATSWESNAWIFQAAHTIENLEVAIRALNNGFDNIVPVILSGEGDIFDTETQFDISTAILL